MIPEVPAGGSVGYLTHMAHIALVLIGGGHARLGGAGAGSGANASGGELMSGAAALAAAGLEPLVLEAKEGLSLVNGRRAPPASRRSRSPAARVCSTGRTSSVQ